MLAELVAFTLSCHLPSTTPIRIDVTAQQMTTCAKILKGPPPFHYHLCHGRAYCYGKRGTPRRYPTWQSYCDAFSHNTVCTLKIPNAYQNPFLDPSSGFIVKSPKGGPINQTRW